MSLVIHARRYGEGAMQGIEVVLVRLASTVVSALAKSVLTPRPGAGLVPDPVRPLPKPPAPDKLARVLSGRISGGYATLPEHERLAAVAAVQDTFAGGDLTADRLFAADLNPERLSAELCAPDAGLSPRALDLYAELLGLCCAHLVEQLTAHPSFAARAAVEQTRRSGRAEDLLRDLTRDSRPQSVALAFEQRYAGFVAETQSRLELFGITLGDRRRAEWSLDTAYISLAVSGDRPDDPRREGLELPGAAPTALKVEQALADCDRLVLRGPAGCYGTCCGGAALHEQSRADGAAAASAATHAVASAGRQGHPLGRPGTYGPGTSGSRRP
jgi:hypothetical protein